MTVGDIYWVELIGQGGRAQTGRRPAVILQKALALPTALVVPLTSQIDALRFSGTVLVNADVQNALRKPSVALVFQMTAVDLRFIKGKLGTVSQAVLDQIFEALDTLTGRR